MTTTIRKGASRKSMEAAMKRMTRARGKSAGLDAFKYCGIIRLKESPLKIQKDLRGEWR